MKLLMWMILIFSVVPAAIFLFVVLATDQTERKTALKAGLRHFGVMASLSLGAGLLLILGILFMSN